MDKVRCSMYIHHSQNTKLQFHYEMWLAHKYKKFSMWSFIPCDQILPSSLQLVCPRLRLYCYLWWSQTDETYNKETELNYIHLFQEIHQFTPQFSLHLPIGCHGFLNIPYFKERGQNKRKRFQCQKCKTGRLLVIWMSQVQTGLAYLSNTGLTLSWYLKSGRLAKNLRRNKENRRHTWLLCTSHMYIHCQWCLKHVIYTTEESGS